MITNSEDIIDSRDVIARIEELEFEIDLDDDEKEELTALQDLAEEAQGYTPDWRYGAVLINEDYFEDYAQQLAEDIGAINREASWPNDHIDWEAAANTLKMDYTAVDFNGTTFYIR